MMEELISILVDNRRDIDRIVVIQSSEYIFMTGKTTYISSSLFNRIKTHCGAALTDEIDSIYGIKVEYGTERQRYKPSEFKDTTTTTPIWKWE